MKNLDLSTLGVEEMNEVEMRDVDGGRLYYYNGGGFGAVFDIHENEVLSGAVYGYA